MDEMRSRNRTAAPRPAADAGRPSASVQLAGQQDGTSGARPFAVVPAVQPLRSGATHDDRSRFVSTP
jgi:hypothetical protein